MITWENYEEYMMMHADGELRPDEEQALMAFVQEHPALKKELAAYELTRPIPDMEQVFADKKSLLKPVPEKRTIAFPQWRRYSIAAGIAALVFISLLKFMAADRNNTGIAKNDTAALTPAKSTEPMVAAKNIVKEQNSRQATQDTGTKSQRSNVIAPAVVQASKKMDQKTTAKNTIAHTDNDKATAYVLKPAYLPELPVAGIKEMPCNKNKTEIPEVKDIPAYAIVNSRDEIKKTFWDKLPIDDIKKKQLENIAGAAADVYKDVSTAKQDLYDKSISIDLKVKKRKLIISF